jgi:hypothetical protein
MADIYTPPGAFGTYTNVTGVVDVTAKAEIVAMFTSLRSLYGSESGGFGVPAAHTDFNKIPPSVRTQMLAELTAFAAAIAAAPAS